MILYFSDRMLNILGQASTSLPDGLTVIDDLKIEDIKTGVASFECYIPFANETRAKVNECTAVGNYILRSNDSEQEFYTIIDTEEDTEKQRIYIYAEDAGMDLLNEVVGSYEADKAYPIEHYIDKFAYDSGFVIGVNEAKDLSRKLSWEGESTAAERIASVATQFDGCEISYTFDVKGLEITNKFINIFKQRGNDLNAQLRLNRDIHSIITSKSIKNLATALQCTGGTPESDSEDAEEETQPITLQGYVYDDGDFYVAGDRLYSREAAKRWSRYIWSKEPNQLTGQEGHIVQQYSYDTLSQETLCAKAISELKKLREIEVNYECEIKKLPDNIRLGDRVNIVDDAGGLYISARLLKLETSIANQEQTATLGEYLIKGSGIHQKVAQLAAEFAKLSVSAARAKKIADASKAAADAAKTQADTAVSNAANAQTKADEAVAAAQTAQESAKAAQDAAKAAQDAVDIVEKNVDGLQTTVANAQAAAEQAQQAATTADTKATEAQEAAVKAQENAATAKDAADKAQTTADTAVTKADTAQGTADTAKAKAEEAATTAAAAKLDAESAQNDIDSLGEELTTMSNTMQVDYARKTDLTEATASLQTQITQNADNISSTASRVQTIDETANNAAETAEAAQTAAAAAQAQADAATADAQAAQTAADEAAQAAADAQSQADTAKTAAATAQAAADKAESDLQAAQADLATVQNRVDATEEDIAAAQAAVNTAQAAADKAKADAATATTKAAEAQNTADTAVTNAANAQAAAKDAADKATIAQATADEAKGDAAAAKETADAAKEAANAAQLTADTAKTNAANAQAAADEAAIQAQAAQTAANDADAKAAATQADLSTAKKNLADVTSRVDATEEEVEAAKADVIKAQQAADAANAEAAAAQATADKAKADAATAQTAADNAKTAADAAQTAAEEAQAAADAAQKDVDDLAVRVTSAETKITQNSNQIALMATKEEVTQTLGGFYTKEETDAAITVQSSEIRLAVSSEITEKINDIEIGGRNLVVLSTLTDGYRLATTGGEYASSLSSLTAYIELRAEDNLTYTVYGIHTDAGDTYFQLAFYTEDNTFISRPISQQANTTEEKTSWTVEVPSKAAYARAAFPTAAQTNVKIEYGGKSTDWTPAPEDTENDINIASDIAGQANDHATSLDGRVTETETSIEIINNSIASLVVDANGSSLMEQTSTGWKFNIGTMQSNLSGVLSDVEVVKGDVSEVSELAQKTESLVNDLTVKTAYINMSTDDDGDPCIELGKLDSDFKVRITNTSIDFMQGVEKIAYITNRQLYIQSSVVTDEMKIGASSGFIWKKRSNGNMGLRWEGG